MSEYVLETYYIRYLKAIRKVSDFTVKHYQEALRYISRFLIKHGKIQKSVFEVSDIDTLGSLKNFLYNDAEFLTVNKRGHQMYSAGFNNY